MAVSKLELTFQVMLEHSSLSPTPTPDLLLIRPIGVSLNPTSSSSKFLLPSSQVHSTLKAYACPVPIRPQAANKGPWAEPGPPPCFIRPGTLFLPVSSAEPLAPS